MHVMRKIVRADIKVPKTKYEVGYYEERIEPGGGPWQAFVAVARLHSPQQAAFLVNFLNGGGPHPHIYDDNIIWL